MLYIFCRLYTYVCGYSTSAVDNVIDNVIAKLFYESNKNVYHIPETQETVIGTRMENQHDAKCFVKPHLSALTFEQVMDRGP